MLRRQEDKMGLIDKMRNAMRSFLQIEPAASAGITITEQLDYQANAAKNRIWYRGDSFELSQLYKQINSDRSMFWAAVPTRGMEIRKAHTGIPKLMVDVLTAVVMADMNDIKLPDGYSDRWDSIAKDNGFAELVSKAVAEALIVGDGAFKISLDNEISKEPIIEFYPGDKIECVKKRGRITEIVFRTVYKETRGTFVLCEHYGYGYVRYELTKNNSPVPLDTLTQTAGLADVEFDKSVMMAVPMQFYSSGTFEGRGRSIFDGGKCDSFDSRHSHDCQRHDPQVLPESLCSAEPACDGPHYGRHLIAAAYDIIYGTPQDLRYHHIGAGSDE